MSAATAADIAPMLAKVAAVDGVATVVSPLTSSGATQVSADGKTAFATVAFSSTAHASEVKSLARDAASGAVKVQVGGTAFANDTPSETTEIIGILAALVILLLVFRSVWAATLPIITGVAGVGVSSLIVMLLSHVLTFSSIALSLGALIGLGVGIDYAVFVVNRQRRALREGADVATAVTVAMNTSGRAVLFAGGTVIIALLGMLILNIGFLTGMAVAAAITVFVTVAAAVTLLPALLAKLGRKVLRRSDRTMSSAFGDGFQSQLLVVAKVPDAQAQAAWTTLVAKLPAVAGVAKVSTVSQVGSSDVSMVIVTPTTTAQAKATSDLVTTLRSNTIKQAKNGTDLQVHVGGTTATSIDFADALTSKLPLFLVIIAGLGFVLLTLAFRSLLVPAIGALGNLVTIAVGLGITVAMFQWGWGPSLFGIGGPAPLEYIVAILMVGVVFGLSMDYHVFLVSRMHEEWTHTHDNHRAVTVGVSDTAKVIATAAGIMACVFASFGFAGIRTSGEFGVGLAVAVLADAFLLRMTIIPAVMHLVGRRNWSIPTWLDRVLPHVSVEGPVNDHPAADRTTSPERRVAVHSR